MSTIRARVAGSFIVSGSMEIAALELAEFELDRAMDLVRRMDAGQQDGEVDQAFGDYMYDDADPLHPAADGHEA